jgi:hypothetical protein
VGRELPFKIGEVFGKISFIFDGMFTPLLSASKKQLESDC